MHQEISKIQKISYALGGFGKNVAYGLVSSYTLFYYNSVLGISATFIGIMLMAARIFDAFNDPFMGVVVAKTRSKYGKYKPWIFMGSVTNALILYAMFTVPTSLGESGMKVFVTITYFLCGITYTLGDIPYWSIIPATTVAGRERENVTLYARTFAGIGAAIPLMIAMALVVWLGGCTTEQAYHAGFSRLALIIAVIYIITTFITLKNLPAEQPHAKDVDDNPSVGRLLSALIHNDHAIMIAVVIILFNSAVYLTTNLAVYLFTYDVGDTNQYTIFMVISGITQFATMVIGYPLLRNKHSNRSIFTLACIIGIIGYALMVPAIFMRHISMFVLLIPGIGISFANGIAYVLTTVFVAGAVDYGEKQTGRRDESIVSSLQTLMVKLSSAFAVLIAGIGIDLIALDDAALVQSMATCVGLRIMFAVPPMILMAGALVAFLKKKALGVDFN